MVTWSAAVSIINTALRHSNRPFLLILQPFFVLSFHVEVRFMRETIASSWETHVSLLGGWQSGSWMAGLLTQTLPEGGRWKSQPCWMLFYSVGFSFFFFPENIPFNFKEMRSRVLRNHFPRHLIRLQPPLHSKQSECVGVCVCCVFSTSPLDSCWPFDLSVFAAKHFGVISPLMGNWAEDLNLFWIGIKIWFSASSSCVGSACF